MKKATHKKNICRSWYHHTWFRILLVIVGVDMILLGISFIFGFDLLSLLSGINMVWRIVGGIAYILTASFVLHYALSYRCLRKEHAFVCHDCVHEKETK